MIKTVLGNRQGPAAILNLFGGCRIGDMACLHVWMNEWRAANPDRRLFVIYNPYHWRSEYGKLMPLDWAFSMADEIWVYSHPNDTEMPPGESFGNFFNPKAWNWVHFWDVWRRLMFDRKTVPSITVPEQACRHAREKLRAAGVPDRFVVVQPLYDAKYNGYRNAPIGWWEELSSRLSQDVPTVVIGGPRGRLRSIGKAYNLAADTVHPVSSLAILSLSAGHVGGETGLPLWSSVLGVPVIFTSRLWGPGRMGDAKTFDFRPIPFKAIVVHAPLQGDIEQIVKTVRGVFDGTIKESSPLR